MDHVGKQARVESARLVQQKVAEINANLPAILTGDFNVDQTHQSYATLTRDGIFNDSYEVAEFRYAPVGTVNSFHPSYYSKSRIDHILLTHDVRVLKYGVFTDTYRTAPERTTDSVKGRDFPEEISFTDYEIRVPSDHYPVRSTIVLP
jgi:endonuclease/exonuclease/phosphatase family metal-dependent hydrolase